MSTPERSRRARATLVAVLLILVGSLAPTASAASGSGATVSRVDFTRGIGTGGPPSKAGANPPPAP